MSIYNLNVNINELQGKCLNTSFKALGRFLSMLKKKHPE